MANRLANDQRFQRGKNLKQRHYAAKHVLGSEVASHHAKLRLLIERATTIYEVDLRSGKGPRH